MDILIPLMILPGEVFHIFKVLQLCFENTSCSVLMFVRFLLLNLVMTAEYHSHVNSHGYEIEEGSLKVTW